MKYRHITEDEARAFHTKHCIGDFPAGLQWVFVEGIQNQPNGRACYLIAGGSGLTGVVSVGGKAA